MKKKTSTRRALWAAGLLVVSGCRTPLGAMAQDGVSSDNSSEGDSSESGSDGSSNGDSSDSKSSDGESSDGASSEGDSSQSDSKSSDDTGNSSAEDGSSDTNSEGSEKTSNSSDEGGSSDSDHSDSGTSESDNAEDQHSRSEVSNSKENGSNISSTVVLAATVVGLGVVLWQSYAARERRKGPHPKEVGRAAQVYLRSRAHQLREDLALGAGPTVEDLAAAARIRRENLGVFGRLLRAHRRELLAMADQRTLTPEGAVAWLERVGALARTDPRLEEDRRAFLVAEGVEEGLAGSER